ncbi:hypothetical protein I4U23_020066 [Adineta vaga]|nr:hypothetical protein I4U23_020066 [Adineta vaga]
MNADNIQYPKISDWSAASPDIFQTRDSSTSNDIETINVNHSYMNDFPAKKSEKCSSSMSPCIQGLLLAIATNAMTLAAVVVFWLVPHDKVGMITQNELPPGTIILFAGNLSVLKGSTHRWLICDGSEVSRVTYQDLFYVIGTMHGVGNGNDTFNLPDFRARFPLGNNDSSNNSYVTGGTSSHTITVAELPVHSHNQGSLTTNASGVHTHSYVDPGHNHGGSTGSGPFSGGSFSMIGTGGSGNDGGAHTHTIPASTTGITIQSDGSHTHPIQGSTGSQGSSQPIDTMPPYRTVHYIIRA